MMTIIRIILTSIVYMAVGAVFYQITDNYIDGLVEEVKAVDYRFEKRMRLKFKAESERKRFIYSVILMVLWPAVCIASIVKAEKEYDIIVHHAVNRMRP